MGILYNQKAEGDEDIFEPFIPFLGFFDLESQGNVFGESNTFSA